MAIVDTVRWESTPDLFAYKYPENNLSTLTQLIVHQSQEAFLFNKGKLVTKFGPGRHTLSTDNIPLLRELYGIPFGGENPFTAEVWFVNKVFVMDMKWGTSQPIQIRDPEYQVMIPVRANGQFGVQIGDSEQFLVKMVGMLPVFDNSNLSKYLKGVLLSETTSLIARKIFEDKISVLEVAAHISVLSQYIMDKLKVEFEKYGVDLLNFYINTISIAEHDESVQQLKSMLSKRAEMSILGYTYQQERAYDVLGTAADNQGTMGGVMGAGMGMGMGFGVGGLMGGMARDMGANLGIGGVATNANAHTSTMVNGVATTALQDVVNGVAPSVVIVAGNADQAVDQAVERGDVLCDKCKKVIPQGAKFCPACGDLYNRCEKCGADVALDAARCDACGESMPVVCGGCEALVDRAVNFCPQCGQSMKKSCSKCGVVAANGDVFCAQCGNSLK